MEAVLGQPQVAALDINVLLGVDQSLLRDPHVCVALGHVGQQQNQDVVEALDRGIEIRIGRLDGPPEPTPKIEFPGKTGAERPFAEVKLGRRAAGPVLAQLKTRVVAHRELRLWEQLARRDGSLGPGLQNPQPGDAQSKVLPIRRSDQSVQDRVVERAPPGGVAGRPGVQGALACVDPLVGHGGRRTTVVRTDLESVGDVVAPPGASG